MPINWMVFHVFQHVRHHLNSSNLFKIMSCLHILFIFHVANCKYFVYFDFISDIYFVSYYLYYIFLKMLQIQKQRCYYNEYKKWKMNRINRKYTQCKLNGFMHYFGIMLFTLISGSNELRCSTRVWWGLKCFHTFLLDWSSLSKSYFSGSLKMPNWSRNFRSPG